MFPYISAHARECISFTSIPDSRHSLIFFKTQNLRSAEINYRKILVEKKWKCDLLFFTYQTYSEILQKMMKANDKYKLMFDRLSEMQRVKKKLRNF